MDTPFPDGSTADGSGAKLDERRHGQAALLLVESLMHALVAKGIMSREDFVETVETAAEVEEEMSAANLLSPPNLDGSLLYPLASAFRSDLGR